MTIRPRVLGTALVLAGVLAVSGCSDSTESTEQSAQSTQSSAGATSTSADGRPECAAVVDSARTLVTDVGAFLSGSIPGDQVRADLDELSDSVATARDAVSDNAQEHWDDVTDALDRAREALAAQPVDTAALRTSVNDALTALRAAISGCAADTEPVPSSVTASAT